MIKLPPIDQTITHPYLKQEVNGIDDFIKWLDGLTTSEFEGINEVGFNIYRSRYGEKNRLYFTMEAKIFIGKEQHTFHTKEDVKEIHREIVLLLWRRYDLANITKE